MERESLFVQGPQSICPNASKHVVYRFIIISSIAFFKKKSKGVSKIKMRKQCPVDMLYLFFLK